MVAEMTEQKLIEIVICPWMAIFLLTASILVFLAGVFILLKKNKTALKKRAPYVIMCFLIAAFCVRYLVGISGILEEDTLSWWAEIPNSIVHALQSFSMDEDYTKYVTEGEKLMRLLFEDKEAISFIYVGYVSILNATCAVAGGTILLVILTSIFPRFRLWVLSLCRWRPVYYFSELNDASLALAQSIKESEGSIKNPIIVFTDAYPDGDDEAVSERIEKANNMGAVCLRNDLLNIYVRGRGKKAFFLIDNEEICNLQTLAAFTEDRTYEKLKGDTEIIFFCQSNANVLVERKVRALLEEKLSIEQKNGKEQKNGEEQENGKGLSIIPVKGYRTLVYNLLEDLPLFTALEPGKGDELNVTIFGTGSIGTEMFLAAYWCGQLLDRKLCINMISKEKKEDFRARIDHINPDIFRTSNRYSDLLRIYKDGEEKSPVYFSFRYIETDVRRDDLLTKMTSVDAGARLVDSDYFVVALGSDEENLEIADLIGRFVTVRCGDRPGSKVPVAYVIYDDELLKTLRKESQDDGRSVMMYPFGSLRETYDYERLVMGNISKRAKSIDDVYRGLIGEKTRDMKKLRNDPYSYWANITRAIHVSYKAFSAEMSIEDYKKASLDKASGIGGDHKLAWLEHRRWMAFMRTEGFRCPTLDEERNYIARLPDVPDDQDGKNYGKHKSLSLKLHPCLVECDMLGKKGDESDENGVRRDLLDDVAYRLKEEYKSKNFNVDFKTYDYPEHEFK